MHDAPADDSDTLAADDAEALAYDPDDPTRLPPRRALWHIAVIGGPHEDDFDLALGYAQAADVLATYWIGLGANDALPVPIYYNYPHANEELDKFLTTSHAVEHLADRLNQYLGRLQLEAPNNRLDQTTQDTLDWRQGTDVPVQQGERRQGKGTGAGPATPAEHRIRRGHPPPQRCCVDAVRGLRWAPGRIRGEPVRFLR
ncbi:hypothetical protein [Streptomyces mirabilis]|uniref:hypothetical protein n=1 Tax=Streptomyces mirabilis TaxID=68239 RepID=UPI00369CE23B